MNNLGCHLAPGSLKIDLTNKKDMKEKVESQYQKLPKIEEVEEEDEDMFDIGDEDHTFEMFKKSKDVA